MDNYLLWYNKFQCAKIACSSIPRSFSKLIILFIGFIFDALNSQCIEVILENLESSS